MGRLQELQRIAGPLNQKDAKLHRERARRGIPGNKVLHAREQQRQQAEQIEKFQEEQRTRATDLLAQKERLFAEYGGDAAYILGYARRRLTGKPTIDIKPVQRSA